MSDEEEYEYRGNHEWEDVAGRNGPSYDFTQRLRVPGGWIYKVGFDVTCRPVFVPCPGRAARYLHAQQKRRERPAPA
jgi:hypothetical protein